MKKELKHHSTKKNNNNNAISANNSSSMIEDSIYVTHWKKIGSKKPLNACTL